MSPRYTTTAGMTPLWYDFRFLQPDWGLLSCGRSQLLLCGYQRWPGAGWYAVTGANGLCNGNPPYNATYSCKGITTFYAQGTGSNEAFNRANITAEAQWRGIHTANAMEGETNPVYVFVIGLGNAVSGSSCVEAFLLTVANDPNGSQYSCPSAPAVFNSSLAQGEFLVVPSCPGATCTAQLTQAFYTIYTKVALRLSQ